MKKIISLAVSIAASAVVAAICFKKAHELSEGATLVSRTDADGTEWVKRLSLAEEEESLEKMENIFGRDPGMEDVLHQRRASIERRKSRHTTFNTAGTISLFSALGFTIWAICSWPGRKAAGIGKLAGGTVVTQRTWLPTTRWPIWLLILVSLFIPGLGSLLLRGAKARLKAFAVLVAAVPLAFVAFGPLWERLFPSSSAGLWPFVATCILIPSVSVVLAYKDWKKVAYGRLEKQG